MTRFSRQICGGTQYYTCSSNGFRGCCSVNPCGLATCPDSNQSSVRSSAAPTSQSQTTSQEAAPSATVNTSSSTSTLLISVVTSLPVTRSYNATELVTETTSSPLSTVVNRISFTASQSSISTSAASLFLTRGVPPIASITSSVSSHTTSIKDPATQTSSSTPSISTPLPCSSKCSPKSKAPLIGGAVVAGIVAVIFLFVVLLWCRRKNKVREIAFREEALEQAAYNAASQGLLHRSSYQRWSRLPFRQPEAPIDNALSKPPWIKSGQQTHQTPHPTGAIVPLQSTLPRPSPKCPDRTLSIPRGPPKSSVSGSSVDLHRWESRYANAASMGTIRLCMPVEDSRSLHSVNPDKSKSDMNKDFAAGPSDQDIVGKSRSLESNSSLASGEWSDASSLTMPRRVGTAQDGAVQGSPWKIR